MSTPEPYVLNTRLVLDDGRKYVITDRAPHGASWRYTATPSDLKGDSVHISHDHVAVRLDRGPAPSIPANARTLIANAGLDVEVFDEHQAAIEADMEIAAAEARRSVAFTRALSDLLDVVADTVHRGLGTPDLHAAFVTFEEAK